MTRCWPLSLLLLGACAGTETGNPPFAGELSYNTYSSDAVQVQTAALRLQSDAGADSGADSEMAGPRIEVDAAWLVLGDPRFIPADRCNEHGQDEPHVTGLGAGDHATPEAAVSPFELASGNYCGLELPLLLSAAGQSPAGAPAVLDGHSIVLLGRLADDSSFVIESARQTPLLLRARDASFAMNPELSNVLLAFDLAVWLEDLDFQAATRDADGVVVVSERDNPALLSAFEAKLDEGVALYRDPAGQGQVTSAGDRIAQAQ